MMPGKWTIGLRKHLHYTNRMFVIKENKFKKIYECPICGMTKKYFTKRLK